MRTHMRWAASGLLLALLAACGGGGSDSTPKQSVGAVKVFGDSLADVGTFGGVRATVQGADSLMYPERIALQYGLSKGCNFFAFDGSTFVANPTAGCRNYAIGGGRINGVASGMSAADPRIVSVQLATANAAGNFGAGDLVLIDGGGNDAADLVGAFLTVTVDGGIAYRGMLGTLLTPTQVATAAAGGGSGLAAAGATYMEALANTFSAQIQALVLGKGATRVAILNMPGITKTPRFQGVLDRVSLGSGGGSAGAAERAKAEALFTGWVQAFNAKLAANFAGNSQVVVIDFYTSFNDQVAHPAQYGLTNVTTPACPPAPGIGGDGLPVYHFPTCTATALSALTPPSGSTGGADWWKTYAFSDGFHPTPYGHQLLSQLIARSLAQAGWL